VNDSKRAESLNFYFSLDESNWGDFSDKGLREIEILIDEHKKAC
jgi:hypothetical protein